jgi:hypothetical protein
MMPKNILFNTISYLQSKQLMPDFTNNVVVTKSQNKEGISYFRFELSSEKRTEYTIENEIFILNSHHLSIYENEDFNNAKLSQYHYTAYFNDRYRLHVYFNGKDELEIPPIWEMKIENNQYTKLDADHLNDFFLSLVNQNSIAIIRELRKSRANLFKELQDNYSEKEKQASELSKNLESQAKEYLEKLEEITELLSVLEEISYGNTYKAIGNLIRHIHQDVEKQFLQTSIQTAHEYEEEPCYSEKMDMFSFFQPQEKQKISIQKNLDEEILSLEKSVEIFKALPFASLDEKVSQLNSIDLKQKEIELLVTEKNYTASHESLRRLHELGNLIQQLGKTLLGQTLMLYPANNSVEKLTYFHQYLQIEHLIVGLKVNKSNLLDFVLTHGKFAINSQPLVIDNKTYPSALHFCVENHSEKTPKSDHLLVLLKHSGCLIRQCQDGLPLAHVILSDYFHPLKPILFNYIHAGEKTKAFYASLISAIQIYRSHYATSEKLRDELNKAIADYSNHTQYFKTNDNGIINFHEKQINAKHGKAVKQLPQGWEAIYDDVPELTEKWKEIEKLKHSCFEKLSIQQQRAAMKRDNDVTSSLFDNTSCDQETIEEIKKSGVEFLDKQIQFLQLKLELLDIDNELSKAPKKKRCKHLNNRRIQIINEQEKLVQQAIQITMMSQLETGLKKLLGPNISISLVDQEDLEEGQDNDFKLGFK